MRGLGHDTATPRKAPLGLTRRSLSSGALKESLGPQAHGAPLARPRRDDGYDSFLFKSSLAWTQANLARSVWVQLSLDPCQIGPKVRGPGTKPLGPMKAADSATRWVGNLHLVSYNTAGKVTVVSSLLDVTGRPTLGTPSSHPPFKVGLISSHLLRPKLISMGVYI